jgi:integrase
LAEAEKYANGVTSERKRLGDLFARYAETTRIEWVMAQEIAGGKFSVLDAVRYFEENELFEQNSSLTEAIKMFLDDKYNDGITPQSWAVLKSTTTRFAKKHPDASLRAITMRDCKNWLYAGGWHTHTRNAYLLALKNFFNWCKFEGLVSVSPCASIRKFRETLTEIEESENRKSILTVDECRLLLDKAVNDPERIKMVPRLALLLFAGLRPVREAAAMTWENNILMDERLVFVAKSRAKDRQDRYIKMSDCLYAWMKFCEELKLPMSIPNWRGHLVKLREDCDLTDCWPKDTTRHTFASYHLVEYGEEATKNAMGHGDFTMLFQNYRKLVKPDEAKEFFKILPDSVNKVLDSPNPNGTY